MMVYEMIRELGDRHLYRVRGRLPSTVPSSYESSESSIKVPGLSLAWSGSWAICKAASEVDPLSND